MDLFSRFLDLPFTVWRAAQGARLPSLHASRGGLKQHGKLIHERAARPIGGLGPPGTVRSGPEDD